MMGFVKTQIEPHNFRRAGAGSPCDTDTSSVPQLQNVPGHIPAAVLHFRNNSANKSSHFFHRIYECIKNRLHLINCCLFSMIDFPYVTCCSGASPVKARSSLNLQYRYCRKQLFLKFLYCTLRKPSFWKLFAETFII
jgi:hypothetical protein